MSDVFYFSCVSNIQVENPVAVLDQEEAKKFLTGKSEDKYNFFMKATELERVDKTYATSLDHVEDMIELNNRTKDGLEKKMEHVELLKKRYEEHLEIDRLEEKLHDITLKFAWSMFHQNNDAYNQYMEVR
jgi:structural maintenance of chromosomes protein 6